MPEFVSTRKDEQIITVTEGLAKARGLRTVNQPATDSAGRPLPPRPAEQTKAPAKKAATRKRTAKKTTAKKAASTTPTGGPSASKPEEGSA